MKIFYSITKSKVGGAQTHISQLSQAFSKKDHKVAVMSHPGGWLENKIKENNVEFYPNPYFKNSYNPLNLFKAQNKVKEAINDFQPDIISSHSSYAGFVTRMAVKNDIPTIFTAHGWGFTPGTPFLRRQILKIAEKTASKYCSKIICVSEFDKKLAIKNNIAEEEKLETIHNGIEIQKEEKTHNQFPIGDKIKLIFVARLNKQKDPLTLLKAFNEIVKEGKIEKDIELTMVGGGPKEKKVKDFIEKNNLKNKISLLGKVKREKVFEKLNKSHLFTLTSNWEGFPRSILEAMSCGLPVIASNVGGVSEAVDKDVGAIVEPSNKKELKEKLEKLLSDPDKLEELGKNSRDRLKKHFSVEQLVNKTESVYKKLIN